MNKNQSNEKSLKQKGTSETKRNQSNEKESVKQKGIGQTKKNQSNNAGLENSGYCLATSSCR